MGRISFWLGATAMLLLASNARATVSFQYIAIPQGTVAPNSTVTYNLYLQETVTGKDTSLLASEGGLYGAGINVSQTGGTGATITSLSANSQTEPDGFTGNNQLVIYQNATVVKAGAVGVSSITASGNQASMSLNTNDAYNPQTVIYPSGSTAGGSIVGGVSLVWLGSMTISVANFADAVFTVQSLHDAPQGTLYSSSFGNTVSATNQIDLDNTDDSGFTFVGANGHPSTFTINVGVPPVPEPGSLVLCGFASLGMGFVAWRRRKLKLQAETPAVEETQPI